MRDRRLSIFALSFPRSMLEICAYLILMAAAFGTSMLETAGMHASGPIDPYLAGDLIGFTAGLLLSAMLAALALRTGWSHLGVALCGLLWNVGGLMHALAACAGVIEDFGPALQFSGAAMWPVPLLAVWGRNSWLRAVALMTGLVICAGLWFSADTKMWKEIASYNGSAMAIAGLIAGGRSSARAAGRWLVTVGVVLTTFTLLIPSSALLVVVSKQVVLIVVLGAFLFVAEFRYADQFLRYALRILVAAGFALGLVLMIDSQALAGFALFPRSVHLYFAVLLLAAAFLAFVFMDRAIGNLVNRYVFRMPDFQESIRSLDAAIHGMHSEPEITRAVTDAVIRDLSVEHVCVLDAGSAGEIVAPVNGQRVLSVTAGPQRRGFLTQELEYLRNVAALYGERLLTLEHQQREALLREQVMEAELRALRAQINPHFLFNALNSIANSIATNPAKGEAMTLRLARVFRHVLANSSRRLSSVQEETEFLRTYLQIEEARFGDRLSVDIEISPDVEADTVPSLILQPIVENALKHGLAPKVGGGHLRISARAVDDRLCIQVEDDGMGLGDRKRSHGVGLVNVMRRLETLYRDEAHLSVEPRTPSGTQVTLTLPRSSV